MPRSGLAHKEPIPAGLRFSVFDRDGFVCQYCGRRPPDVVLHCDHILPECDEGPTVADNLVTSCAECNRGKGSRPLSTGVGKPWSERRDDLAEQVRQLEAYGEYLDKILDIRRRELRLVREHFEEVFGGISDDAASRLRAALQYHPPAEVIEAMEVAAGKFHRDLGRGYIPTKVWKYFYGVLRRRREARDA